MMMANKQTTDQADHIDLSRCYAKLDKSLIERKRRRNLIAVAANRVGDDSPWLVLRVMTGREITVRDALDVEGIETLVPMKMGKKIHRRGFVIPPKKEPVFIGYILARCIICNEALAALLGFEHVLGLLGGNDSPYLIADQKICEFNQKADQGHYDFEVPQQVFRCGMKVMIREGIFAGSTGEIVSGGHTGKGNAVVDINFFGGSTHAIMPLAILAPL
ncbi:transcription termination/antitermination protein NusG [Brucella anthropi]|uniref:transcription termination/antitermination protein NusG n=1 Tax=Brucella anthropi TaxID=529 RepID=UPI00124D949D|nr:transcription termination/antitermination NusG family protein [Brucella anthropi]KAB2743472.1 antitermination protein NusG [Brucella anthropi]KAB2781252.1 antitermination protein NusG [Brucella anthropi]